MPAVNLVNIAPSVPEPPLPGDTGLATGAQVYLHQKQGNLDPDTGLEVHDGKPIARDPTATLPKHDLGPRLTFFSAPTEGGVYCGKAGATVNRKLSAADQARAIVHDWAMHSDASLPAFVLPASSSKEDAALAEAVAARFAGKAPTAQQAEDFGRAYHLAGRGDRADAAFHYLNRAVGLTPRVWLPGEEGDGLHADDVMLLLAAQNAQQWEEMLAHIQGPVALILNAAVDTSHKNLFSTGSLDTAYTYLGLSANSTTPVASDTSMTGEITTAGGGLVPGQITYAHTNGTGTSTGTRTATANGSDSLPVTLAQMSLRSAGSGGGTLGVKELFSSTATISASGDAITVTYTPTVSSS